MRSSITLFLLTLFGIAATTVHGATLCDGPAELCGTDFIPLSDLILDPSPTVEKRLTNAERFARHLPPAPPRYLRRGSPTRRTAPSSAPPPSVARGVIEVYDTEKDKFLGYISKNSFSQAQYRYQDDTSNALIINFSYPTGETSVQGIDLAQENSDIPTLLYIGLVQGRDSTSSDIASGNFNYGYFAGTDQTPKDSAPAHVGNSYTTITHIDRTSESAVWSVDLVSGKVTVQWVNEDTPKPTMSIFSQGTALYFGGDQTAFASRYPSPVTSISFKFIPIV